MGTISNCDGRLFVALRAEQPAEVKVPAFPGPFPCLIWDHLGLLVEAERRSIAACLLDAGCRYAVCGGANCSEWENAVDFEYIARHLAEPDEALDESHVMTTSHKNEDIDDVAFFFVQNTNFDNHDFRNYLILHVGASRLVALLEDAVRKHAEQAGAASKSDADG